MGPGEPRLCKSLAFELSRQLLQLYSLDLSKNSEVTEQGVQQLSLEFFMLENFSVEVLLEGESLAGYRPIWAHRSQSSGDRIGLENLGREALTLI